MYGALPSSESTRNLEVETEDDVDKTRRALPSFMVKW